MLDSMFGLEFSLPMKFFIAFAIVLILIGAAAYLLRRFGSGALAVAGQRSRQPRLAVVDATAIDNRRKLVIVRRDNVEHLLLIGGPTDVLVEPNIVRGSTVQSTRETSPVRTAAVSLPEASGWPIAAEPQPVARAEPVIRPVAPVHEEVPVTHTQQIVPAAPERPAQPRVSAAPPAAAPVPPPVAAPRPQPVEASAHESAPEVHPAAPVRPAVPAPAAPAPVAGAPAIPTAPAPPRVEITRVSAAAVRVSEETAASPAPEAATQPRPSEEQNLAEMAHRLEAALSRPAPAAPPRPTMPPAPPLQRPQAVPPPPAAAQRGPAPNYENLQREMASLLGRQSGGS
jgi:flagellar biogenesis protein FliO